jgi:hypothetical protein
LGTEEASTTTDANGDYSLTVDPVSTSSTYLVCEEDKSGWNQTSPSSGDSNTDDCPNGTVGHTLAGSSTWSEFSLDFTNEKTETNTSGGGGGDLLEPRNEQESQNGEVTGTKRSYDTEAGLSGWKVSLHDFWSESDGFNTDPEATTTTRKDDPSTQADEAGQYTFNDVPAGDYLVCEEGRNDWTQREPQSGESTYECENGTTGYVISVDEGGTVDSRDFMNENSSGGGTMTGTKRDYDTEEGLSGWQITLHDFWSQSDGYDKDPETTTTTTSDDPKTEQNEAGAYEFDDVPAGDYLICEENRSGWQQTNPTGGDKTYECENGTFGYVVAVSEEGEVESGYNFINKEEPDGGTVFGTKRSYDTEAGLAGWEITLHEFWSQSDGFDITPTETTTTRADDPETDADESGTYAFEDVPDGTYLVCEENRAGWTQHTPQSGDGTYQCENGTEGHIVVVGEENEEAGSYDFTNESGGEECAKYYEEGGEDYYGEEGNEMPPECDDWGGGDKPDPECEGGQREGGFEDGEGEYTGESYNNDERAGDRQYGDGSEDPDCAQGPGGGDGGSSNGNNGGPASDSTPGLPDTGDGSLAQLLSGPSK